jgi:integrase
MAVFAAGTGRRDREICSLRWQREAEVPELDTNVFIIPGHQVKNPEERLVVLNRVAKAVVEVVRGIHAELVFTFRGRVISATCRKAWRKAREQARLPQVRVHDLEHTFGRRLRAAGVSFEDRQDFFWAQIRSRNDSVLAG